MKHSWLTCVRCLVLLLGILISACQPAQQSTKSVVIPVTSSSSEENDPPVLPELPPTRTPSARMEKRELLSPTAIPTRVIRSTVPALPPGEGLGNCAAQGNLGFEEETLVLVNLERGKINLPPLEMNNLLVQSARVHSADMACHNYFNHYGIDGYSPFARMKAAGYQMAFAGENIYAGPDENNTPAEAVRRWMNSPSHRNAILNENYTEAGVGYYFYQPATYDGYFTMDFASPGSETDSPQEN